MGRTVRRLSVTEAARNFADAVNRAFYRNEVTLLIRNGTPVAQIAPASAIGVSAAVALERWKELPRLAIKDAAALAEDIRKGREKIRGPASPWE